MAVAVKAIFLGINRCLDPAIAELSSASLGSILFLPRADGPAHPDPRSSRPRRHVRAPSRESGNRGGYRPRNNPPVTFITTPLIQSPLSSSR